MFLAKFIELAIPMSVAFTILSIYYLLDKITKRLRRD